MKNAVLPLVAVILLVAVANLLVSLGLVRPGGGKAATDHEYKALSASQMDNIGFRLVAKEEGIEVSESGEITFPKEKAEKILNVNLVPRTIHEVEKDGGWKFAAVTPDGLYLFKRAK